MFVSNKKFSNIKNIKSENIKIGEAPPKDNIEPE
jgi:hypothetical protein